MGGQTRGAHAAITRSRDTVIMSLASQWRRVETRDLPEGRSTIVRLSISVSTISIVRRGGSNIRADEHK